MTFELVSGMFRINYSVKRGNSGQTAGNKMDVGSMPVTKVQPTSFN